MSMIIPCQLFLRLLGAWLFGFDKISISDLSPMNIAIKDEIPAKTAISPIKTKPLICVINIFEKKITKSGVAINNFFKLSFAKK